MALPENQKPKHPSPRRVGRFGLVDPANLVVIGLMAVAVVVALVILVVDHYDRVDDWLIIASSILLLGSVVLLIVLGFITERARTSAAAAEKIRAASVEVASYCVITTDARGRIVEWNEAAGETFGHARADVLGEDAISLIVPAELQSDYRLNFNEVVEGSSDLGVGGYLELGMTDVDGRVFPVELSVAKIDTEPPMFTMFARSLTESRLREEENRRLADVVRSSGEAIVSVDLNGRVTSWNPGAEAIYGHGSNDVLARRLSDLVPADESRKLGALFRRILNGFPAEMESERRGRDGTALWVISRAFPILDIDGTVAGMSLLTRDITDKHHREVERERDRERSRWRQTIVDALDRSGFELWGQPVFELETGGLSHHELLIRMARDGEIVLPHKFLPHAQNSELISRIDRWVIETGVAASHSIPVAINLSGESVSNPDLGSMIAGTIDSSGADPAGIRFEITESAAIENLEAARKLVRDLNELGCQVSLDDFGTGYGSFTYLKHLPVNEIKIDTSFICDLTSDEASRKVVASLIAVAGNFSIRTVAEGIEDEATAVRAREMGIDLAQGIHLGRPAPLEIASETPRPESGAGQSARSSSTS